MLPLGGLGGTCWLVVLVVLYARLFDIVVCDERLAVGFAFPGGTSGSAVDAMPEHQYFCHGYSWMDAWRTAIPYGYGYGYGYGHGVGIGIGATPRHAGGGGGLVGL